ncbi:37013_t:CDS:1, partial [Racocetra persica]
MSDVLKKFNLFEYKEFDNIIKIDEGEFGNIYKAYWKDCGLFVALKVLKTNGNREVIQE